MRATWLLMGCAAAAFVADIATGRSLVAWGAKTPAVWSGEWYRLFTATFLHADLQHLAFNMYALFMFGRVVEGLLGSVRFTAVFLMSGAIGYLASLFAQPDATAVGASAAIFGLMGYTLHFRLRRLPLRYMRIDTELLQILGINLAIGYLVPRIDQSAHLGGLFGGALMGAVVGLPTRDDEGRPHWLEFTAATAAIALVGALTLQPLLVADRLESVFPAAASRLDHRFRPYFAPLRAQNATLMWLYADDKQSDWQPAKATINAVRGRPVQLAVFWRWERGVEPLRPVEYTVRWIYTTGGQEQVAHVDRAVATAPDRNPDLIYARSGVVAAPGRWQVRLEVDGIEVWQHEVRIASGS